MRTSFVVTLTICVCLFAQAPWTTAQALPTAPIQAAPVQAGPNQAGPVQRVGSLYVQKSGSGSRAVILVAGLACGGWVWDDYRPKLEKEFVVYTVTLAGFDGTPPETGPHTDRAVASLVELVRSEKLTRPVLVGHSLGGHLGLRVAQEQPALLSGLVTVDALALYPPPLAGDSPELRKLRTQKLTEQLRTIPPQQYAEVQRQNTTYLVNDPKTAALVAERALRSDRTTVIESLAEMSVSDLRYGLGKVTVPTLVLLTEDTELEGRAQYQGLPRFTVQVIPKSRHFIMLDQPEVFTQVVNRFLKTLQ